jgi:hypothetical protein
LGAQAQAAPVTTGSASSKPAIEVITGFSGSRAADNSKPANEVITGFLPEVTLQEQGSKRPSGASEPYREMIELELSRGRNAMGIWQDLVDKHGFRSSYQSVQRFVLKLRGAVSPEARVIIETKLGEEAQVDYGTGPMVRDPDSGKYRRTRLFVLTLGCSRKWFGCWPSVRVRGCGPSFTRRHFAGLAVRHGSWSWTTFARACCLRTSTIRA